MSSLLQAFDHLITIDIAYHVSFCKSFENQQWFENALIDLQPVYKK